MTTLESLVPSLEVCQQLKAAGFPQDTALVWVNAPQGFISGGGLYMDENGIHQIPEIPSKGYADEVMLRSAVNTLHTVLCGAPTVQELLDAIRAKYPGPTTEIQTFVSKRGAYRCWGVLNSGVPTQCGTTDIIALAKCLLEAFHDGESEDA